MNQKSQEKCKKKQCGNVSQKYVTHLLKLKMTFIHLLQQYIH